MGTLDQDPKLSPAPDSNRRGNPLPKQPRKWPGLPPHLQRKGSLERRQMAASTHSILMACNRVSYTYVTTHFLIWFLFQTPFQDPIHLKMSSLDRSLLYAWPWNKWFDVLSICLDLKWECEFAFQKGNTIWETVKPDFFTKGNESRSWKAWWSASQERTLPVPGRGHCLSLGWLGGLWDRSKWSCALHPLRSKLSFWTKYWSNRWLVSAARTFYLEMRAVSILRGQELTVSPCFCMTSLNYMATNEIWILLVISDLFLCRQLLQF